MKLFSNNHHPQAPFYSILLSSLYLKDLEEYKDHHPDDKHDPNALELFCDANPDEPECLVYDD